MNLDRKAVKFCEQLLKSNGERISDRQYTVVRMRIADVMSKLLPQADDPLKQLLAGIQCGARCKSFGVAISSRNLVRKRKSPF